MKQKKIYREKNKERIYSYTLNVDCFRAMKRDRAIAGERAQRLFEEYPFEKFQRHMHYLLRKKGVYEGRYAWQECIDAYYLAYMYGIYRCAAKRYVYVAPYIKKVSNIYMNCALVLCSKQMKRASWDETFERISYRREGVPDDENMM